MVEWRKKTENKPSVFCVREWSSLSFQMIASLKSTECAPPSCPSLSLISPVWFPYVCPEPALAKKTEPGEP
eukprot:COSAG06_NODE_34293_length_477_cov_0.462963_1_plen_70_part_01